MADDIVQNIVLQGQDDVKQAFHSIEQAGAQMFRALDRASQSGGFQKFALQTAAVVVAVSAAAAGTFAWAQSSANATVELGRLADAGGTSIENMSTLVQALNIDAGQLEGAFRRMAVRIENEWPQIQKAQQNAATVIIANNLAIQQSMLNLEKAQRALADASRDAAKLEVDNANSVKGARISLAEAIERQRVAEGGQADPEKDRELARQRALLAVSQARAALQQQERKAAEDAANAASVRAEKELAAQQAALKLQQDVKKAREDELNDINKLSQFVDNLAKGVSDAGLQVNVTAENVVKGLLASMGTGGEAVRALGKDIGDLGNQPPTTVAAFLKLADVFHNTEDASLKTAVAVALFGRGVGQEMVEKLSKGSAAILEEQQRLKDLGLTITEVDRKIAKDLKSSLNGLGDALDVISKKMGLAFAPLETQIIRNLTTAVEQSKQKFVDFAQTIAQTVTPVVLGLLQAVTGKDLTEGLDISEKGKAAAASWQKTFESIGGFVKAGVAIVVGAMSLLAGTINALTGADLSGMEVAIGLLILRFTGWAGAILVAAVALDRIFDGAILRQLERFIGSLDRWIDRAKLVFQLLSGDISLQEFVKATDEIDKKVDEQEKKLEERSKRGGKTLADALREATAQAGADVKKFTDGAVDDLDKIAPAAKKAGEALRGVAPAPGTGPGGIDPKSKVPILEQFAKLGVGRFDQLGKTIEVVTVDGEKSFDKIGVAASKSFGQINIDAQKAVDGLDALLGKVELIGDAEQKPLLPTLNDADLEAMTAVLEETKEKSVGLWKAIADVWGVSPADAKKWNVDESVGNFFKGIVGTGEESYVKINTKWSESPVNPQNWGGATEFFGKLVGTGDESYIKINTKWSESPINPANWTAVSGFFEKLSGTSQEKRDEVEKQWAEQPIKSSAWTGVGEFFAALTGQSEQTYGKVGETWAPTPIKVDAWTPPLEAFFAAAVLMASAAKSKIDAIMSAPIPEPGGGFGGSFGDAGIGFAGGTDFPLRGPGTWTSDSIPAWLSRNEAVIQAPSVNALVREFGSNIIYFLNNWHRLPRFAGGTNDLLGGFAKAIASPMPRFDGGGLNRGAAFAQPGGSAGGRDMGTLRLAFPDGREIGQLRGPRGAVEELMRVAVLDQASTLGPPSSWNR